MGELEGARVYLSGPIEMAKDGGIAWRRELIQKTRDQKLDLKFLDPTNKPGPTGIDINEDKAVQQKLQDKGKFKKLRKYVHKYRRFDLRCVDKCDCIIVHIDPTIAQWGTANEVYFAEMQHKPMMVIIEGGLSKMPRWCFDVFDFDNVFESVDAVIERLIALDNGSYEMNDEWVLIDRYLI